MVFTWVNGSDPIFLEQITKEREKHVSESIPAADIHNKRFEGEIVINNLIQQFRFQSIEILNKKC